MKHRVKGYQLNRDVKHRRALFKNLISDLLLHGHIQTTQAKANAVQPTIDKLITHAKSGNLNNRRQVDTYLNQSTLVTKLTNEIAPQFSNREGGYTKITRLGRRRGDNTLMVRLELLFSTTNPAVNKTPSFAKKKAESIEKSKPKPPPTSKKPKKTKSE